VVVLKEKYCWWCCLGGEIPNTWLYVGRRGAETAGKLDGRKTGEKGRQSLAGEIRREKGKKGEAMTRMVVGIWGSCDVTW
jgi:hypothetical protein